MYSFRPKDSDAFGTLEKIATIVMEGRHLIIGDPTYGIDNSRINWIRSGSKPGTIESTAQNRSDPAISTLTPGQPWFWSSGDNRLVVFILAN